MPRTFGTPSAVTSTEQELHDSQRALVALADISRAFAEASFDLAQIFDTVTRKVVAVMGDACFIRLLSEDRQFLTTKAVFHRDPDALARLKATVRVQSGAAEGVSGRAITSGKSQFVPNVDPEQWRAQSATVDQDFARQFPLHSVIAVPLNARGQVIGVLVVTRYSQGPAFTENDLLLMEELADRCALAVRAALQHEELLAERARLRAVVEQMPSAIAIVEAPSGKQVLANALNATIFRQAIGPAEKGIAGYSTFHGLHPDGRRIAAEEWPLSRSLLNGEVVRGEEIHVVRGDGSHGYIRASSAPVRDDAGKMIAGIVTFDDVTEERKAEDARKFLLKATELLSSSLDYEQTLAQVTQIAVPGLADWCAIDVLEAGKIRRLAVAHVDPAKVELARTLYEKYPPALEDEGGVGAVLRTGESRWMADIPEALIIATIADPVRRADTLKLGLRSFIAVPLVARGAVLGALSLVHAESGRNHTEADKQVAEELARRAAVAMDNALLYRRAQEALGEQQRLRELEQQLIAIVSHDLRNPIDAVGMSASLLMRRGGLDAAQGQTIGRIMSASDRAARLIRDFLDFTHARSAGKIPIARSQIDLFRIVRAAVDEVHLSHPERKATVVCVGSGEGAFDADRISQLVGNLVSNAFQHSPGTEHVLVTVEGKAEVVTLAVHNGGPPISRGEKLFEPFKRGDAARAHSGRSIGLGLHIVKLIAEAHDGTVAFESNAEKGTLFSVVLPRKPR